MIPTHLHPSSCRWACRGAHFTRRFGMEVGAGGIAKSAKTCRNRESKWRFARRGAYYFGQTAEFAPKREPTVARSELLDGGFRLQQDRNPVANGVHPPALVALKGIFPAHYQGFSAYRTGEYLQQVRADHGCDSNKKQLPHTYSFSLRRRTGATGCELCQIYVPLQFSRRDAFRQPAAVVLGHAIFPFEKVGNGLRLDAHFHPAQTGQ